MVSQSGGIQSGAAFAQPRALSGLKLQALAYLMVSVAALACDTTAYLGLAALGSGAAIAGGLGYLAGLVVHFLMSKAFVFAPNATAKSGPRLFLEFAASGVVGLGLTMAVIALAVGGLGIALLPAKIAAVVASFATVFAIRRYVVFAG